MAHLRLLVDRIDSYAWPHRLLSLRGEATVTLGHDVVLDLERPFHAPAA